MCWLSMSAISTAGGHTGRLINARLVHRHSLPKAIPVATSLRRRCSVGSITSTISLRDQPDGDFAPYSGTAISTDCALGRYCAHVVEKPGQRCVAAVIDNSLVQRVDSCILCTATSGSSVLLRSPVTEDQGERHEKSRLCSKGNRGGHPYCTAVRVRG